MEEMDAFFQLAECDIFLFAVHNHLPKNTREHRHVLAGLQDDPLVDKLLVLVACTDRPLKRSPQSLGPYRGL